MFQMVTTQRNAYESRLFIPVILEAMPTLENSAESLSERNVTNNTQPFQKNTDIQLTLNVPSADWYAGRGRLPAKNWGRLSRKEIQENVSGLKFSCVRGSIDENIQNILNEQSETIRCKRKSELQGLLAVGKVIKSTAIISTQEAGKVYITAKNGGKNLKKTSSYWFSYFGKYFNIAQLYLKGKAYIMENRNQDFDAIVQHLQNIIQSNQCSNSQID